jgi:hypothetical protein
MRRPALAFAPRRNYYAQAGGLRWDASVECLRHAPQHVESEMGGCLMDRRGAKGRERPDLKVGHGGHVKKPGRLPPSRLAAALAPDGNMLDFGPRNLLAYSLHIRSRERRLGAGGCVRPPTYHQHHHPSPQRLPSTTPPPLLRAPGRLFRPLAFRHRCGAWYDVMPSRDLALLLLTPDSPPISCCARWGRLALATPLSRSNRCFVARSLQQQSNPPRLLRRMCNRQRSEYTCAR